MMKRHNKQTGKKNYLHSQPVCAGTYEPAFRSIPDRTGYEPERASRLLASWTQTYSVQGMGGFSRKILLVAYQPRKVCSWI